MVPIARIATLCMMFFCAGCFGPVLNCPESLIVGEEAVLVVSTIYDAIDWEINPPVEAATFLLTDGSELPRATTSVMVDPAYGERSETEISIRAIATGVVTVRIQETSIGPPILPPPRPAGGDACTIQIIEDVP